MSLTDKILNDRIFKSLSEGMSESDKANLEKSTEEGVESLSDAIKPVIAPTDFEDVKK